MERQSSVEAEAGFVPFLRTGQHAKGEFHCSECRYGVTVFRTLPRCPMCGGQSWEQTAWSPFHTATSAPGTPTGRDRSGPF
jgi:hypothetical protein